MVIVTRTLKIQQNRPDQPIDYFMEVHNKVQHFTKSTCFIRYIGINGNDNEYVDLIKGMDERFASNLADIGYLRLHKLDNHMDMNIITAYSKLYEDFITIKEEDTEALSRIHFPYVFSDEMLNLTQKKAFQTIIKLFESTNTKATSSMIKNFSVKLLYWMYLYLPNLYQHKSKFPKLVFVGNIKLHEYLFLYYLMLLGCDVLYLNSESDISFDSLKDLSYLFQVGDLRQCNISLPEFAVKIKEDTQKVVKPQEITSMEANSYKVASSPVNIQRPQKAREPLPVNNTTKVINTERNRPKTPKRELEYEDLARLASSVVMIKVYNEDKECFKSGSGVVVSRNGYILTNFHVASQGAYYGVRYENEEEEYFTDALIKYHDSNDLALLRVEKYGSPVEVYQGPDVVRGQRVVAIGSPLGLFNSVSDGIISGFRTFDDVAMIQFTAPISHGSSGGALLDKYGRLIGLLTGGFDSGQNLNLAVSYNVLYYFIRGFIGL